MVYFEEGLACSPKTDDLEKADFRAYKGWEKALSKGIKILKLKKENKALQQIEVRILFTHPHYHKKW